MALRGSLREFELAEIFQLISRDAKTGQLVISHQDKEAFIIFSQGAVVAAGNNDQNLQTFLFKYLMSEKRYSEVELNELLYVCQGEMRLFSLELVNRNYMSHKELVDLAQIEIEDLACSLFLWEDGNYRFDTLDSIHEYTIDGVTFPVDAITMEAMRRNDEWKRMIKHIRNDTVFFPIQKQQLNTTLDSPFSDPSGYILSFVDGSANIGVICEKTIFIKYRVYEALFGLWQNSAIAPLAAKRTQTLETVKAPVKPAIEVFAATAAVIAVLVWFSACFAITRLGKNTLLRQINNRQQQATMQLDDELSYRKIRIASLQYRVQKGFPPSSIKKLLAEGLIAKKDISPRILTPPSAPLGK
jgi:hypothetical protein